MKLHHEEPPTAEPLKPFVNRRMHTCSEANADFCMTLPPTGVMYLTFVYGDEMTLQYGDSAAYTSPRLFIGGQVRRYMPVSRIPGRVGLMGVEFSSTGFYRLFHQDCSELTDRATPLRELVPEAADHLERQMARATDNDLPMALLQEFLLERVSDALATPVVDEAVNRIEQARGCISVGEVAGHCGLGVRQLHRHFLKVVGIGPKHFAKSVQIKQALFAIERGSAGELTALAQHTGYFDQAHFVRDFQRMIGTNPLGFLHSGDPFLKTYMKRPTG